MNNWLEQFLDRRLGVALCFLATIIERARCLIFPVVGGPVPVRRILFVKPVEQGAIVLAYGALRYAVERVGRENVYFFAFDKNREILDILDVIPPENVITARDSSMPRLVADMLAALLRMWRLRIDTAVDLEIFARISILIAWLSGARRRVGLHRFNSEGPYRGGLVTHRVQYNPYLHTSQAFEVFVRAAFVEAEEMPLLKSPPCPLSYNLPRFTPTPEDVVAVNQAVDGFLPALEPGKRLPFPVIVFNPKCLDELPARKWADDAFVALGRMVMERMPEARIVVTGLPAEVDACARMVRAIDDKRCASVAGKVSLRGLITLLTMTDALVSTDSGPAHFAALTDISGVVLFGPETPLLYSPLTENMRVLYLGLACSPCFSPMNYRLSPCTDNQCLKRFTMDEVFEALAGSLQ